jgi:hypothetical protein
METKATSVKLNDTDKVLIKAICERQQLDSIVGAIRFGLAIGAMQPPKIFPKKSKKTG